MTDQPPQPHEPKPERWLDGLVRGFFAIRVPLAMALLAVLVLTSFDQTLEVHRVLTQDRARNPFDLQWLLALASL
ncbi:MAG TPA: hypothetical protein VFD32_19725, partial [Dehalococcoidia bacterium]|nr:hypothetical protein [Dehalococcoidia bacterium]